MDRGEPRAVFLISAACSILCIGTVIFGFFGSTSTFTEPWAMPNSEVPMPLRSKITTAGFNSSCSMATALSLTNTAVMPSFFAASLIFTEKNKSLMTARTFFIL